MEIKSVSIIGLGALGIMYGEHFTERLGKNAVRFIADESRIKRYQEEGIYSNGKRCSFQYITPSEPAEPADLLIFAVKFSALEQAIKDARSQLGGQTIVLSVLNGVTSERIIGEAYGMENMLYCTVQGMDASKQGNELSYQNRGSIIFGEWNNERTEKVQALSSFLDKAGLSYSISDDIQHQLWSKLMLNTGVNQCAAVFETGYRAFQKEGKQRDTLIRAMQEVRTVAEKEGIVLREAEIDGWLKIIDSLDPEGMPSMRQDTLAGRKTEVELFAGTITELGRKHGIPTPVNASLYEQIKKIEEGYLHTGSRR